ncbi:imm11 family protein [Tabrizicola sp.]|uniref:imm11 family protein n=1 Tax=Tabrizicola sp. TaxID=2005166 RepID=UPI003F417E58
MPYVTSLRYSGMQPHFEFDDEPKTKPPFGFSAGVWIDPARMPTSARQTDKPAMCNIFTLPGLNGVGARFKEIVERLEPGKHQFFPLKLRRKNDEPIEGEWFIFNACEKFDEILVKYMKPEKVKWAKKFNGTPLMHCERGTKVLTFSRPQIAGRHFWITDYLAAPQLIMSNEAVRAMKEARIKYFDMTEQLEADDTWIPEENIGPVLEWQKKNQLK